MHLTLQQAKQLPLRATRRLLREAVRQLPVSSRVLGPPKSTILTTEQWCKQHDPSGAEFHALTEEIFEKVGGPIVLETLPEHYTRRLTIRSLPQTVALIPQGRVCHGGLVISPDDYILGDTTYQYPIAQKANTRLPILDTIKLPRRRDETGTIAVISSLWTNNYYHWFFDVLPRLHILRASHISCDRYILNCETPFQQQTLQLLGIAPDQCIPDTFDLHLQAERLVVPSLPGGQGMPPSWIVRFLKEAILHPILTNQLSKNGAGNPADIKKRLYINRADHHVRRVTNKADVLSILEPKGFQSVTLDGMSLAEQALLFNSAEAIVAPHGAALTNLIFCKPGTRVIEFAAPGWIHPLYNNIASHGKLQFGCLIGTGKRPLPSNDMTYMQENITVNIAGLEAMLKKMEI